MQYKLDILGSKWILKCKTPEQDPVLQHCDGYTDKTTHTMIVLGSPNPDCELGDFEQYHKKIKRHEIIHAYLFASGLHENFIHPEFGHDETFLDWVAVQFPKLLKSFQDADAL